MNVDRRVANRLGKPVMLFDGECRFCRLWVGRWRQITGDRVEYLPFQAASVAKGFPELSREELERAVHFIDADGLVFRGAVAVFRSLATNPRKQWLLRWYEELPSFARATESIYNFIAAHRRAFSGVTRLLWGEHVERGQNFLTRWLFLRGLGIVYLVAFVSLWAQVSGLLGSHGILPAADLMTEARRAVETNSIGADRFRILPTLCWISDSDVSLQIQCASGAMLAIALVVGIMPPICAGGLWLLYLSLATVGQDFLAFQWDSLLLETGFLAIFLAPGQLWPHPLREKPPSRAALWLLRLLLFKLMFLSGVVKLTSGDPLWRNLTALAHHYETQPLPNSIAWHLHQMPLWFHKISCVMMFAIELVAPLLLFGPRRLRTIGASAIAALQMFILLTGNYAFFNWLTLVLCITACDDFTWSALLPQRLTTHFRGPSAIAEGRKIVRWANVPIAAMSIVAGSICVLEIYSAFGASPFWAPPVIRVYRWIAPFRSVNNYGLFAVMTPDRPEIMVEGSNDARDWKEYAFRFKPVALNRPPPVVAPHQPRLDWQMWFAALGDVRQNPWFLSFCQRLLEGSPEVSSLLDKNPFVGAPPKYIRARLYDYRFTTRDERARTGNWWKREFKGEYLPAVSLEILQRDANR